MKKITAFLLLGATIFMTSCNNGKPGDAYLLKMRLAKGDKFSQDMDMNMDMNFKIMGMDKTMKMQMNTGVDFEVLDTAATGKDLKFTYTKMDMTMDMGMPSASAITDSLMKKQQRMIVGKSVVLTVADNKVINVKGFDELMSGVSDSTAAQTMQKMFSKENFNSMFGTMFNLYPGKPVKEGDSWTADNSIDISGVEMNVKTKYTLIRVKDNVAEVGVEGTIDSKGTMVQRGVSVDMDMTGTQKGKLNVGLADGYLKTGNYDMDVNANMNVMGQKMPMTMKVSYKVSGK